MHPLNDSPRRLFGFAVLGLLFWVIGAHAGTIVQDDAVPGFVHEVFGPEDGLPVAGIVEALQTRDGYLWLATFDGLVRFDGVRFRVFDSERIPALGSNRIIELHEDRDGTLWILGQQGYLTKLENGRFLACGDARRVPATCDREQAGAPLYREVLETASGTIYFGGEPGLYRLREHRLEAVAGFDDPAPVKAILEDSSGRLWVGTREGLWRQEGDRFEAIKVTDGGGGIVSGLAQAPDGTVWASVEETAVGPIIGDRLVPRIPEGGELVPGLHGDMLVSSATGLHRIRENRIELVRHSDHGSFGLRAGRSVTADAEGAEWISWNRMLLRDGRPVLTLQDDGFSISSVTVDRQGSVWVTTTRSGELHAFHPAKVQTLAAGLPSPILNLVYEDPEGPLWAGGVTLATLDRENRKFVPHPTPFELPVKLGALLRDRAGRLWMGTSRGLYLEGEGPRRQGPDALRVANVFVLTEDSSGTLWVGTQEGVFLRSADGAWTRPPALEGESINSVRGILELPDGTIWLAANGHGVIRLQDGALTRIDQTRGLSSDLVRAIWPAPDGRLWIATENYGLNRLDPATVAPSGRPDIAIVGRAQGLEFNGIHQIVSDRFGHLWMSSNQGVLRVSLEDLDAVADGRLERITFVSYTERDGLRNRETNGGFQQAGLRDRNGIVWFPSQAGAVRIDPREALEDPTPPPIHIESLRAGDAELPWVHGEPVTVAPEQRSFTVAFSAPSFQSPQSLRFRYRLTPFDPGWVRAEDRREAFYTRVPPGKYTFEVAVNEAGTWSTPASLGLQVVPRYFETRWFFLLCALATTALVAGGIWLRGTRQRARQETLERIVRERTATISEQAEKLQELDQLKTQLFANVSHELRTPLTLILGPLRDALDGAFGQLPPALEEQVRLARRNARRLLFLVDQLLDIARLDAGRFELQPRRGDLRELLQLRLESFLPLAERRRVDLRLDAPAGKVYGIFDPTELEKVFDNLLANALKYTPEGGSVDVRLEAPRPGSSGSERDGVLRVTVTDDGPGIPEDQLERIFDRFHQVSSPRGRSPGAGLGLALSRQLVELHGGTIRAELAEGRGARFVVELPQAPAHLAEAIRGVGAFVQDTGSGSLPVVDFDPREPWPSSPGLEAPSGTAEDRTTVLVVDDNADLRAYLRRHLQEEYRVIEAEDGAQALRFARSSPPDLVVSDVMMPGLDGNALFRALREDPALELIPVILVTAKASEGSRIEGLREGVDDYLAKPFDPDELRARVANLIGLRRRLRERLSEPKGLAVSEIEALPADQAFLERVKGIIEKRIDDSELTVEALSEEMGCDRSHLLRRLRALTSETPSGLIRSLRLQRAAQLLEARAGAVNEIAYSVGFKSVAHFSNAFLERFGERPSAYADRRRPSRLPTS